MQNFAAIGQQSSEITRGKKEKNKCQQNLKSTPQAIASEWTKKP